MIDDSRIGCSAPRQSSIQRLARMPGGCAGPKPKTEKAFTRFQNFVSMKINNLPHNQTPVPVFMVHNRREADLPRCKGVRRFRLRRSLTIEYQSFPWQRRNAPLPGGADDLVGGGF